MYQYTTSVGHRELVKITISVGKKRTGGKIKKSWRKKQRAAVQFTDTRYTATLPTTREREVGSAVYRYQGTTGVAMKG